MKARSTLARGAIAGALAATAVAAWFLGIDAVNGQPLRTPEFLARVLLDGDGAALGAVGIAIYTLAHYAVFIAVGVLAAWAAERLGGLPGPLLGLVLGFLLFDLLFYGSVLLTGVDVVNVLGWPQVLIGNLIAGVTLFAALSMLGGVHPFDWRGALAAHRTLREGIVAGLVGAGLVAAWFMAVDLIAGRPFFTPAALGSAVFLGTRTAASVQVGAPMVLGYTVIHVTAFLVTGLVAAAFVAAAEDASEALLLGGILLFGVFEVFSIGLLAIVSQWLVEALAWWNVVIANLIAALGMGGYLAWRHPRLLHGLARHELEEDLAHEEPVGARPRQ